MLKIGWFSSIFRKTFNLKQSYKQKILNRALCLTGLPITFKTALVLMIYSKVRRNGINKCDNKSVFAFYEN